MSTTKVEIELAPNQVEWLRQNTKTYGFAGAELLRKLAAALPLPRVEVEIRPEWEQWAERRKAKPLYTPGMVTGEDAVDLLNAVLRAIWEMMEERAR